LSTKQMMKHTHLALIVRPTQYFSGCGGCELRKYKKMPSRELIDFALNGTLSRTLLTSCTTLLALLAIFILGGPVLRGMSFALIWGVVVGTYSSIFVASSLLLALPDDWRRTTKASENVQGFQAPTS